MNHPGFWDKKGPFRLRDIAEICAGELQNPSQDNIEISDVQPLNMAGASDIGFLDNSKYIKQFRETGAAACICAEQHAAQAADGLALIISPEPYKDFARALALFYPEATRPKTVNIDSRAQPELVHPSAVLEDDVIVEPGAVVGPEAHIGSGSLIAAGAVIGYRVHIGRNSYVGPGASVVHALVGDRVTIHGGARIGQDGFGFAMGPGGHMRVPQVGRVIIQDDVDIGANSAIDRGALADTVIGEGCKIDNLVQVGHNVVMGRHCVVAGHVGISGSTTLGDYVVLGGQAGTVGHITIADGTQVAGAAKIMKSTEPGSRLGGFPAQPLNDWLKEVAFLRRLVKAGKKSDKK